jgi:hypothetical protein
VAAEMSLEEQAKNNRQINHMINRAFLENNHKEADKLTKQKWVPLESAQKLQEELEDVKKVRDALGKHHNEIIAERNKFIGRAEMAEAKLTEANKVLDNIAVEDQIQYVVYKRLRGILK